MVEAAPGLQTNSDFENMVAKMPSSPNGKAGGSGARRGVGFRCNSGTPKWLLAKYMLSGEAN